MNTQTSTNKLPLLASVEDLCEREGLDPSSLSDLQKVKIEKLLEDASAKVRRYTRQNFTVGISTVRLRNGFRGLVDLPQKPVIRIISVDGTSVGGSLDSWESCISGAREVTYEHGYEEVPADIVAVVCGMVQRTMNIHKAAKVGISQQSVGPYSISFASWATGGNLTLSPEERKELKAWRNPFGGSIAGRY